jgi:hypothetical protein
MITDLNQACFVKMISRRVQEVIPGTGLPQQEKDVNKNVTLSLRGLFPIIPSPRFTVWLTAEGFTYLFSNGAGEVY